MKILVDLCKMFQVLVFTLLVLISDTVFGQTTSGVLNGQYYLCLPTGIACPTSSNGAGTIDPRIVTPTGQAGTQCPAGTVACFGTTTTCGNRFITPNMTGPGPSSFGAYPWQAYLRNSTNPFAGSGVLVSPFFVVTAAHKVYLSVSTPTSVVVLMGVWNPNNLVNVQNSTVAKITVHPSFVPDTLINDIAVLQLTQPIVLGIYTNINTACLAPAGSAYIGQQCAVSGWGQNSFENRVAPSNPQKQVFVSIVNYTTCRTSFSQANLLGANVDKYLDPNGEICAGGQMNLDACTQDGGSPLVCPSQTGQYSAVGLVIWGKNCGRTGVYGVYVNLAYYNSWISSQIATVPAAG